MGYAKTVKNSVLSESIAAICTVVVLSGAALGDNATATNSTAERLVDQARQAQLDGDSSRQFASLRQAVRVAPDYDLARWYLGQVQVDGEWLAVEEAQRRAAADPLQAEYRELRAQYEETPQGQLALARWCRKNNLDEEARFHWASVLSVDPNNEEALRAVDRRWHNGQLLTREDIATQKEQLRETKRAIKRWKSSIAKWRRAISGSDNAERESALAEIRSLTDYDVIPAIEDVTLGRDASRKNTSEECRDISLAFIEALGNMPASNATESLVRHALWSPADDVRTASIEKLKPRPQHDYVPLLLSGLAMPIESSFHVRTEPDGSVHYTHSLYREGPDEDWSHDLRRSALQHDLGYLRYTHDIYTNTLDVRPDPQAAAAAAARKVNIAITYGNRFGSRAVATESQVEQFNQTTTTLNTHIIGVLAAATEQDLGDSPRIWWDWWQNHNEYFVADRPVKQHYDSDSRSYYHGGPTLAYIDTSPPPPPPPPGRRSCFAKGTLVWTKTGQRPIESLELGELVLSQNVDTGELAYQPVIGRTVRPPSEMLSVSINNEELRTTLGHPFWVAGIGWRMAKELGEGAILQGIAGSPRVQSIQSDGEEEAYNLVVADFNTYFVGDGGILVHDNTPRTPTRAEVPGLPAK